MKWLQQVKNVITNLELKFAPNAAKNLSQQQCICIKDPIKTETTNINAHTNVTELKEGTMENTGESNLSPKNHQTCKRCGKKLKNEESKLLGFGPLCYKRHMAEQSRRPLFEVRKNEQSTTEK